MGWHSLIGWYYLTDGTDCFYRPSPDAADKSPPILRSKQDRGEHGDEEEGTGEGVVNAGPLAIPWSKGNQRSGWLYLFRATGRRSKSTQRSLIAWRTVLGNWSLQALG